MIATIGNKGPKFGDWPIILEPWATSEDHWLEYLIDRWLDTLK